MLRKWKRYEDMQAKDGVSSTADCQCDENRSTGWSLGFGAHVVSGPARHCHAGSVSLPGVLGGDVLLPEFLDGVRHTPTPRIALQADAGHVSWLRCDAPPAASW